MATANDIQNGDWKSKKFWRDVDSLPYDQKCLIVAQVGCSRRVRSKYLAKIRHAKEYELLVGISVMDYAALLYAARIDVSQVTNGGYHLARAGDTGDYTRRNCRFIPAFENIQERRLSETSKARSVELGTRYGKRNIRFALERCREYWKGLRESDPKLLKSKMKKVWQASAEARRSKTLEKDKKILDRKLSKAVVKQLDYPNRGWKVKTTELLGFSDVDQLRRFLGRNPSYENRLFKGSK